MPAATASPALISAPPSSQRRAVSPPTRSASRRVPSTRPKRAPGKRNVVSGAHSRTSHAANKSAPAPQVRPCATPMVRTGARHTSCSNCSTRTKRCSRSPSLLAARSDKSKPVQKCAPAAENTSARVSAASNARATCLIKASTNSAESALPFSGRFRVSVTMPSCVAWWSMMCFRYCSMWCDVIRSCGLLRASILCHIIALETACATSPAAVLTPPCSPPPAS